MEKDSESLIPIAKKQETLVLGYLENAHIIGNSDDLD
jgi:hypothetical protein